MTQRKCVSKRPFFSRVGFLGILILIPVSRTNGIILDKSTSLSKITRLTPGFYCLKRIRIFFRHSFKAVSGDQTPLDLINNGSFSHRVKGVKLITHLHLLQNLRKHKSLHSLLHGLVFH